MRLKYPITVPLTRHNGIEVDIEIPSDLECKEIENGYRDGKSFIEVAYNGLIVRTWVKNDMLY